MTLKATQKHSLQKLKALIVESRDFLPDAEKGKASVKYLKLRNVPYQVFTTSVKHHLLELLDESSPYVKAYFSNCYPLRSDDFECSIEILKRVVNDFESSSLKMPEVGKG